MKPWQRELMDREPVSMPASAFDAQQEINTRLREALGWWIAESARHQKRAARLHRAFLMACALVGVMWVCGATFLLARWLG